MKQLLVGAALLLSMDAYGIRGELSAVDAIPDRLQQGVVSLLKQDTEGQWQHRCSGSLIAESTILTAAHCFDDKNFAVRIRYQDEDYQAKRVRLSAHYKREDVLDPQWQYVYDIRIENDFALIDLDAVLPKSAVVALAPASFLIERTTPLLISGFGQTANIFGLGDGEGVYRVSALTAATEVTPERIHVIDGATGSCQGDSGGPLWAQSEQTGAWLQVGVTSQGDCHTFSWFERVSLERLKKAEYEVHVVNAELVVSN